MSISSPQPSEGKPGINVIAATPSPLSFSKQADKPLEILSSPSPFASTKQEETKSLTNPSAPSLPFTFAAPTLPANPSVPFSFGQPSEPKKESELVAPKPLFGGSAVGGLFADASKPNPLPTPVVPESTPSPLGFAFGSSMSAPAAPPSLAATEKPKPTFSLNSGSTVVSQTDAPKPLFSGGGFSFGQPAVAEKPKDSPTPTPFTFGATTPSAPATPPIETKSFSFGSSTPAIIAPTAVGFSFSGTGTATSDVSQKPFTFGQPTMATPERPTTPPKGPDNEVRMEESPAQEMQVNGNRSSQFSFGNASSLTGSSTFGGSQTPSTTTPFSFPTTTSHPFGAKKPEEPKSFSFNAPPQAPPINTSFSFGQAKDDSRPSSAAAFSFGQTPTSTPTTNAPFSFGSAAPAANPFGQSAAGSAPSSPSTFSQSFGFGASAATPVAAPSNPFGFGSQPNSPAGGNVNLPPPAISTTFGNGAGFGQAPSPSSPFTAPQQIAPSTSGGALFTIGAAPTAAPSGQRAVKKLPRRGPVKR